MEAAPTILKRESALGQTVKAMVLRGGRGERRSEHVKRGHDSTSREGKEGRRDEREES